MSHEATTDYFRNQELDARDLESQRKEFSAGEPNAPPPAFMTVRIDKAEHQEWLDRNCEDAFETVRFCSAAVVAEVERRMAEEKAAKPVVPVTTTVAAPPSLDSLPLPF